jgi:hypothetical protein
VVYQCYQGVAGVYYLFKLIQQTIKNRHITHPPSLLGH